MLSTKYKLITEPFVGTNYIVGLILTIIARDIFIALNLLFQELFFHADDAQMVKIRFSI